VCACRIEAAAEITPVPAPPMPPGRQAYADAQRARTEQLPPTSSQGRGTSQP
jgi:assimilatory nitrate reductase catalytic subunit